MKKTRRFSPPGYTERIAAAFAATGLNQSQLARAAQLEVYEVGRMLGGGFPGDFGDYERFAKALGLTWQELLVGEHASRETRRGQSFPHTASDLLPSDASDPARAELEQFMSDPKGLEVWNALSLIYRSRKDDPEAWSDVAGAVRGIARSVALRSATKTKSVTDAGESPGSRKSARKR